MRREVLLVAEMIDAAEQAMALVAGQDVDSLGQDRQRRDALLWNFTVLGEAAAQLPAEFKGRRPAINWSRPSQLRNRIVHGYWCVDMDILVATAEVDLPAFVDQVRAVLAELEREAG